MYGEADVSWVLSENPFTIGRKRGESKRREVRNEEGTSLSCRK